MCMYTSLAGVCVVAFNTEWQCIILWLCLDISILINCPFYTLPTMVLNGEFFHYADLFEVIYKLSI